MIFISGNTPSSKNSKRIITITNKKTGKKTTRLINSEVTEKYIKNSALVARAFDLGIKEMKKRGEI